MAAIHATPYITPGYRGGGSLVGVPERRRHQCDLRAPLRPRAAAQAQGEHRLWFARRYICQVHAEFVRFAEARLHQVEGVLHARDAAFQLPPARSIGAGNSSSHAKWLSVRDQPEEQVGHGRHSQSAH